MRSGAEFFTEPSGSAQRRYEAMRAYFVDEQPAERVADQFGYSTASVHQMATLLRSGRMRLFADRRPGPKGPVKATGPLREKVISLRARRLSAWQSAGTLLLAAATRVPRAHHIDRVTDDAGLAFFLGLTALPKATHLSTYSYRARRESSQQLLTGLIRRLRPLGLAGGGEGFNCDFHAIRHHGDDPVLEEHYVPARSQRTRSVLTFFASDHASGEMVYANADITKTEQAREIIAFADYWKAATGQDPALLVFDSQLTTYKILDELSARRITWLTLRQRGKAELARLAALPASA